MSRTGLFSVLLVIWRSTLKFDRRVFAQTSPRSRRRAAGRAPRASDPPPPGWRWSSWWWFSVPSPSGRWDTPAGSRRWSPRSAAPRTPGRAGCAPAPLQPPTRSGWMPSPPRLLGSVPGWAERSLMKAATDFDPRTVSLWCHYSIITVSRRIKIRGVQPQARRCALDAQQITKERKIL